MISKFILLLYLFSYSQSFSKFFTYGRFQRLHVLHMFLWQLVYGSPEDLNHFGKRRIFFFWIPIIQNYEYKLKNRTIFFTIVWNSDLCTYPVRTQRCFDIHTVVALKDFEATVCNFSIIDIEFWVRLNWNTS